MVSEKDFVLDPNGKTRRTAKSKCNSRCVIYHAQYSNCNKIYVGKSTQRLNNRISGHRGKFFECSTYEGDRIELDDDDHLLGLHLHHQHGIRERRGFNDSNVFTVLEICSPRDLDAEEHLWIQRMTAIKPFS